MKDLRELLMSMSVPDMKEVYTTHNNMAPKSLTSQFTERRKRDDAIQNQRKRQRMITELFPTRKCKLFLHHVPPQTGSAP